MLDKRSNLTVHKIVTILLFTIAAYLCFYNLQGSYLWKDEAHTAYVANNVLKYGLPKVWDGKNLITGTEGNDFNRSFVLISKGWLQFYITALSLAVFGNQTFAARLPFALFGFFTILINYLLGKKIFKAPGLAILTLFYNLLCVQFILYIRTCRDYAVTMFFISLTTFLLFGMLEDRDCECRTKRTENIKIVLSILTLTGIFYSNHLFGLIYSISLGLYTVIYHRIFLKKILFIIIFGGFIWLPWYIYVWYSGLPSGYTISNNLVERFLIGVWKVQVYFFPFITVIAILFFIAMIPLKKKRKLPMPQGIIFFILLTSVNILIVALVEFFIVNHYYLAIAVAVPFFMTYATQAMLHHSRILSVVLVFFLSLTNILNIAPMSLLINQNVDDNSDAFTYGNKDLNATGLGLAASPYTEGDGSIRPIRDYLEEMGVRCYFLEMLYEIQNGYDSVNKEIVQILNQLGNENDIVLYAGAEPEPIVFYTKMRLVRTLTEEASVLDEYFDEYPNKIFAYLTEVSDKDIDWFIISSHGRGVFLDDSQFLEKNREMFQIYQTTTGDLFLSNSPDLDYHKFQSEYSGEKVIIMHKK